MFCVFSFNMGKKLVKSILCINDPIFMVYKKILIPNNNNAAFEITFIPLLLQYITKIINNEQLIIKGVLYKNCDSIKLLMLYKRVIANGTSNNDIIILIQKPIFLPNKLII